MTRIATQERIKRLKKARTISSQVAMRDRIEEIVTERAAPSQDYGRGISFSGERVMVTQRAAGKVGAEAITLDQAKRLAEKSGIKWEDGYEKRLAPVWSSDERVNRYGDIDLQVWEFQNYNVNPVILLSHDWDSVPIGSSISHEVLNRTDGDYNGPALRQIMLFAPGEANPVSETVNRLWQLGFLRTVSVAFYPGKIIDVEDSEERADLGLGKWGMVYTDLELIECSPCSVPALPSAHNSVLNSAKARSLLRASDFEVIRESVRKEVIETNAIARWRLLDENLRHVWRNLFPDAKFREHSDPYIPVLMDSDIKDKEERNRFDEIQALVNGLENRVKSLEAQLCTSHDRKVQSAFSELDRNISAAKSAIGVQKS